MALSEFQRDRIFRRFIQLLEEQRQHFPGAYQAEDSTKGHESKFRILVVGNPAGITDGAEHADFDWYCDDLLVPIAEKLNVEFGNDRGFEGLVIEVENWDIRDTDLCARHGVQYGNWLDPDER